MKHFNLIVMAAICSILVACGLPSKLSGVWTTADQLQTIEFFKDGTVVIKTVGIPVSGTYTVVDSKHIKVSVNGPVGALAGEQVVKVTIEGNRLALTLQNGLVLTYVKKK